MSASKEMELSFKPLIPETWDDIVRLFGPKGAGGCWCQWFKLTNRQFDAQSGEGNKAAFKTQVEAGHMPGVIAYYGDDPVGWCAIEPRERYPRLNRSPLTKPVDDLPVWSLTCLFVAKEQRKKGLSEALIKAAIEHARAEGARMIEAYPKDARHPISNQDAYHGVRSTFARLGFIEVARRSETRPVMRYKV